MSELEEDIADEYDVDEDYDYDFEEYDEYQDALDYCYECRGYGNDYILDENDEPIWKCPECNMNPNRLDGDYDD